MRQCIGEREGKWGSALQRARKNEAVHWREGGEMGQCIAEREGEWRSALERGSGNGALH